MLAASTIGGTPVSICCYRLLATLLLSGASKPSLHSSHLRSDNGRWPQAMHHQGRLDRGRDNRAADGQLWPILRHFWLLIPMEWSHSHSRLRYENAQGHHSCGKVGRHAGAPGYDENGFALLRPLCEAHTCNDRKARSIVWDGKVRRPQYGSRLLCFRNVAAMRTARVAALAALHFAMLASPSASFGQSACPPPPCDLKKEGPKACEAKATWVLEGTVESLSETVARRCQRFGDVRECLPPAWSGARVGLSALQAVKMPMRVIIEGPLIFKGYGSATIESANPCWEGAVRLPTDAPTKRVRFYGMEKYQNPPTQLHGWAPSASRDGGYFAYEFVK